MKKASDAQTSLLDLDQIGFDPGNANKHNAKNEAIIEQSITEMGAGRSILVDENNRLIAGEGTVKAAIKSGMKKVLVVEADGDTIIAVKRSNLTDLQKIRMGLADNAATRASEFDKKMLKKLVKDNPDQQLLGGIFDERDMRRFSFEQEQAQGLAAGGTDVDPEIAEAEEQPIDQTRPIESQVRMVQLFLTVASQPEFVKKVRDLSTKLNTKSITDTVLQIVRNAHAAETWPEAAEPAK